MECGFRIAERYVAPLGRSPLVPSTYFQFRDPPSGVVLVEIPRSAIRNPHFPESAFHLLWLAISVC
jgi:hypothetical protein